MTLKVALYSDIADNAVYAANCGAVSRLAEHLKYAAEESEADDRTIAELEKMEFEYWNEANMQFQFWEDYTEGRADDMEPEELIDAILALLPDLQVMSNEEEIEFIRNLNV